ncbi:MAG: zf-HC2 domain-containing protein [Gemmatimonadales bacterium]|nr:zf-HC2 domain-containing protein [Gemmatimonadales bacterium]
MSELTCVKPHLGDLLGAYEMGLLEKEDQSRFETHLFECPACLEDLYSGAVVSEELRADPSRYASILVTASRSNEPSLLDRMGRFFHRLLQPRVLAPVGVVAAVALVLMVFQPGQLPRAGDLAIIEPLPYQGLELRGDAGQGPDQLLAESMEDYVAGNFSAAAASLGLVWAATATDPEWSNRDQTALFLGLCLLLDDRPNEAIGPLTSATRSLLLPIAERGKWYLAQTHLLREDPKASALLLENLLNSPVYGSRAADQLQSVRQICNNSHGS